MSIAYREKEILDIIKNLREPSVTQIKRRCGLSIATIKSVCKKLVDEGYLKDVEGYRYCLTDKGANYSLKSAKLNIDDDIVKELAAQVAEQVGKQIRWKRFIGQESEIAIKTDFIPEIEDETGLLDSNIGKLGAKLEKEEDKKIEESARLLKNARLRGK